MGGWVIRDQVLVKSSLVVLASVDSDGGKGKWVVRTL